jgi:hypothetical protein
MNDDENALLLSLGDVINIVSPMDESMDGLNFLITYIDSALIELMSEKKEKIEIKINEDNSLSNQDITQMNIIARDPEKGYARQNQLIPFNWVDIYFGGDIPAVITANIIGIVEDQIELKTTDGDVIYIDFSYKGLPKNIPIGKFVIRGVPPRSAATAPATATVMVAAINPNIDINSIFPDYNNVDKSKLQLTEESIYSVSKVNGANFTIQQIANYFKTLNVNPKDVIITDGTANVGSDTIMFGIKFKNVNSVEIDDTTYNALKNNVDQYKLANINVIKGDINNVIDNLTQDVIYLDAPWGGRDYKKKDKMKLYLGDKEISDFVSDHTKRAKLFALKVPFNYDFSYLENKLVNYGILKYPYTHYGKISYYIILIVPPREETESKDADQVDFDMEMDEEAKYDDNEERDQGLENDNMLFSADQIIFGDELESIQQLVDVPESEQRFTMETQIDDLINVMISYLDPRSEQIKQQMNQIKTIAERYRQLRDDTSVRVDETGKPIEKGSTYKPVIDSLKEMNKKLYWILPVVKNIKKLYDVDDDGETVPDDAELLRGAERIKTESDIYNDFMNNIEDDKYQTLVKKMDPYLTPFSDPSREVAGGSGLTTAIRVKDNITAIVDNLGDLESSVFSDSNYIRKKRFLIQEYNLGLNTIEINKRRGGDKSTSTSVIVKLKQITEPDKMTIKSILTLPKPVVEFSHINLPTTSILKRANLNQNFISIWRLLNDKTIVHKSPPPPADNKSFFKHTRLWERESSDDNDDEVNDSTFEGFLNTIIPVTSSLFNLTKYDDQSNISLANMIEKLEPFLIYLKDISIKQYEKMIKHIELKLKEFDNKVDRKRKEFELLDSIDDSNGKQQTIKTFFEENVFEELREAYEANTNINDSEFLQHCIKMDNGRFLNVFFSRFDKNASLLSAEALDKLIVEEKEDIEEESESRLKQKLDGINDIAQSRYLSEKSRLKTILNNRKRSENMFSLQFNVEGKGGEPVPNALISPLFEKLEHLRDSIIGQKDERKRYTDILMFVKKYTKQSSNNELFWLYDIAANQKIIPTFIVKIANAFVNNKKDYETVVDKICREQGKTGEDGDTIVDKYSGYVIKTIDFDTDEGYTDDGFKIKNRSVLEKDEAVLYNIGDAIEDAQNVVENDDNVEKIAMVDIGITRNELNKSFDLLSNPLSKPIMNIINAISANIGVYFNSENLEFIIENTIITFELSIRTKEQYNEMIKNKDKDKKKRAADPYEVDYNKKLLVLTLCYLLATIQTSIPTIKPKKSFPGCKATFAGYPFVDNDAEDEGMNYILCVAHKIRKNNEEPWKSIERTNSKELAKLMKKIFNIVLANGGIQKRMSSKREYEETTKLTNDNNENNDIGIIEEINVKKWDGFLPTMSPIEIDAKKIEPLSKAFYATLEKNIKDGSRLQEENMNTAYGKSIYYSLYIQQLIKTGVLQNSSILKTKTNVPYLENSCCNDGNRNPMIYFTNLYSDIKSYMKLFVDVSKLITKFKRDRSAPILFHPFDTKRRITSSVDLAAASGFTEETYYRAFYYFCKYREKIPFSDEVKKICQVADTAEDEFTIDKLKASGYEVNNLLFEKLMDFINNKNIIEIEDYAREKKDVEDDVPTIISMIESSAAGAPKNPTNEIIFSLLSKLETSPKEGVSALATKLVDELYKENRYLMGGLKEFLLKTHSNKKEINKWNRDYLDDIFFTIKDQSFLKHSILSLATKLPNAIINSVSSTKTYIPKHWGLSSKHEINIKQMIDQTTRPLDDITNSENIDNIKEFLSKIQKNASIFQSLSKATYLPQAYKGLIEKTYLFYILNIIHIYIKTSVQGIKVPGQSSTAYEKKQIEDANKKSLSNCVLIIKTFVTILCDESRKIVVSYKKLTDKMNESKESEKDIMTKKLNMLTTEARNVEKVFKEHKIGKWGKGLEKGLRIYQKETYDTEMDEKDSEDKEKSDILDILLQKRVDKNGNTVDATDQSEMIDENEEEDRIGQEDLRQRGGENEEDDYDYEMDFD